MANNLIWVLVTDGAHARVLQRDNYSQPLIQIRDITHTHETTHEHGPDKPGRGFEKGGTMRHAYEPKTDWHEHQKEVFVKELSQLFIKEYQEKKFQKVYLVSPPKIMGLLRGYLSSYLDKLPVSEKLQVIEISKDLTHHSLKEIEEHMEK